MKTHLVILANCNDIFPQTERVKCGKICTVRQLASDGVIKFTQMTANSVNCFRITL